MADESKIEKLLAGLDDELKDPTFFHCAPIRLAIGSIIEPGNWGRMFSLYAPGPIDPKAWREVSLEFARQALAPDKPSRLKALFALADLGSAIAYRDKYNVAGIIHEVAPTAAKPNRHDADYELTSLSFPGRYFSQILDSHERYWTQPPTNNIEILFDCSVKVVAVPSVPPVP